MKPKLVIFDCDGVLVDSEMIACRVDAEYLSEIGFPTTADDILARYVGRSAAFMVADIEARFGRRLPDDFSENVHQRIALAFDRELTPVAGVAEAIARIPCGICVASSSTPRRLERSLRVTGLLDHFHPHIFSATQVKHGKPAPDLFLFAANQMGIPPADCVVIEDSPAGVQAARAAGMRVVGFTGGAHCGAGYADALRDAGAGEILSSMDRLGAVLSLR